MHICIQYLRVALAFSHDNLRNGATYGVEILQADPRGACEGRGLGLMSIGVIIGKKIVLFKNALQIFIIFFYPLVLSD